MKSLRGLLSLVVFAMIIMFIGCSAQPSKVSKSAVKAMGKKVTYFKDMNTGICYSLLSSRLYLLGFIPTAQKGLGFTSVPCEECEGKVKIVEVY